MEDTVTVRLTIEQAAAGEYVKAVERGELPAPEHPDVLEDAGAALCTELRRWSLWWR